MPRLKEIKPLEGYRLWLRYDDGVEGVVDLSPLVGQGVFALWEEPGRFQQARIGDGGEIVWSEDVDLCADALYLQLTGKQPEDIFPQLKAMARSHA